MAGLKFGKTSPLSTARTWEASYALGLCLDTPVACLTTRGRILVSLTALSMAQQQIA